MRWITGSVSVSALRWAHQPAPIARPAFVWPSAFRTRTMLDPSTLVKKSASQVSCVLDEEVAVLNLDRALYFGLVGIGAHIWAALEESRSVAELCDGVMAEYDVGSEVCRADVSSFLNSMCDAGLVELS